MVVVRVVLLDKENFETEISKNAVGQELYNNVKQKLNVEESDYFSLSYRDANNLRFWLNMEKRIDKQIDTLRNAVFYWEVKFYPPAPEQLNEDLTRYLLVLQARSDILTSRLPASFYTLSLLASFTAQGEMGNRDEIDPLLTQNSSFQYLEDHPFIPGQTDEMLYRISELHKTHKGLTPAEADLYFLDNVKKLSYYGVDLYPVKNSHRQPVQIGVSSSGLIVYDRKVRLEMFKWPRILKISYKRNVFNIKVRPAEFEKHEKTLGYKLPTSKLAKRLWRIAVETHQFFRLKQPELTDTTSLTGTLGFGPRKWRMSGRTAAQLKSVGTLKRPFTRSSSISSCRDPSDRSRRNRSTDGSPVSRRRDYSLDGSRRSYDDESFHDPLYSNGSITHGVRSPNSINSTNPIKYPDNNNQDVTEIYAVPHKYKSAPTKARLDEDSDGEVYNTQPENEKNGVDKKKPVRSNSTPQNGYHSVDDGRDGVFTPTSPHLIMDTPETANLQPQPNTRRAYQPRASRASSSSLQQPSSRSSTTPNSPTVRPRPSETSGDYKPRPSETSGDYKPRSSETSGGYRSRPSESSNDYRPRPSETSNDYRPHPSESSNDYRPRPSESPPVKPRPSSRDYQPRVSRNPSTGESGAPVQRKSPTSEKSPSADKPVQEMITPNRAHTSRSQPSTSNGSRLEPACADSNPPGNSLPMPRFSLESAGIMPTGGLDKATKLGVNERTERTVRVGMTPPTVATTTIKFNDVTASRSPRTTRNVPTVETRPTKFTSPSKLNTRPDYEPTVYVKQNKITETTLMKTTEKDGNIEKRVKHKIVLEGDDHDSIDDQMLMTAIQSVTGLDSKLGVDKIEIKTEVESENEETET